MVDGGTESDYIARLQKQPKHEFQVVIPDNMCAYVMERVVSTALGCIPAPEGDIYAMKFVCEKHGVVLILDEVMCGMGRCGKRHTWMKESIGKGLGGAYAPVAEMLMATRSWMY